SKGPRDPRPERRKVERPPYEQLLREIEELGYSGVGRTYGVSDNAVRKWVRWYRARLEVADGANEVRPEAGHCDQDRPQSEYGRREAA
ncbi:MAG TPA: hypothetical protein VG325_02275, partial [Solirubrobacteraceae bacterium]|nr:hypothetical protein [Solirubrobacteraceae bacterium]